MRALLLLALLGACSHVGPNGQLVEGIPTPSGYYAGRDAGGACIHVHSVLGGLSGYHAGVLRDRLSRGERLCDGSAGYGPLAYSRGSRPAPKPDPVQ